MSGGRKPTHHVSVHHEASDRWVNVGVGWMNDKGTISIKLKPYIDLGRMGPDDHMIVAIKRDKPKKPKKSEPESTTPSPEDFGDDVPF